MISHKRKRMTLVKIIKAKRPLLAGAYFFSMVKKKPENQKSLDSSKRNRAESPKALEDSHESSALGATVHLS